MIVNFGLIMKLSRKKVGNGARGRNRTCDHSFRWEGVRWSGNWPRKQSFWFFVGATSLVVSTVSLSGCARITNTNTELLATVTSARIPVQLGYDGNEQFCGTLGKIQYVAIKHEVHFNLRLTAVKANREYSIDWQNNTVRGYTVGVFLTDHSGAIRKGSLRMYRPGESAA